MSTKITINNNGSIKVEGDFTIVDREGNTYDLAGREVVGLCGCGLSKNKSCCPILILANSAKYLLSKLNVAPSLRAQASTHQNPALCLVSAYSRPGFPKPTISLIIILPIKKAQVYNLGSY